MESDSLTEEGTTQRRPRRDKRRERNLEALLAAAIEVTCNDGPGALTAQRVTAQAGLHKRAFYAHFTNPEACLHAVAVRISEQDLERNVELHRAALASSPPDHAASERAILDSCKLAMRNPGIYRLLIRCRYDDSVLGEAIRAVLEISFSTWTDFYWELALREGVQVKHLREVRQMAEHLVEHNLVANMRAITGADKDLPALAARMQRHNRGILKAEFRRMLAAD